MSLRDRQIRALRTMLSLNAPSFVKSSANATANGNGTALMVEPQWKVLIFDQDGQDIISPLLSVKELRELGVTLHLQLKNQREAIGEAPAVYFVQANEANVAAICNDFQHRLYESFYLNFTGSVPRPLLEELATSAVRNDLTNSVAKVFDQYLDYIALEEDLFALKSMDRSPFSFYNLNRGDVKDAEMANMLEQTALGLFSVFATLGSVPVIRAARGNAAERVAEMLDGRIRDCLRDGRNTLFTGDMLVSGSLSSGRPLLVIVDRSIDLTTMLHHTWTYQALVHDVLNMNLNKVEISDDSSDRRSSQVNSTKKTYSLNPTDPIWSQHRGSPFPKVAEAVQESLDAYKAQEGEVRRLKQQLGLDVNDASGTADSDAVALAAFQQSSTVASLTSAVNSLPELLEKKRVIDMHTNLATALLDAIKARKLDEFFEKEERLISNQSVDRLNEVFGSQEFGLLSDQVRLALIATLCGLDVELPAALQQDPAVRYIRHFKSFSSGSGQANQQTAGGGTKTIGMFPRLFGPGSQFLLEGVKNLVLNKRKLPIVRIVDNLAEGKSNTTTDDFRYLDPKMLRANTQAGSDGLPKLKGPFQEVYVFVVGGGNYIEYLNLLECCSSKVGSSASLAAANVVSSAAAVVSQTSSSSQSQRRVVYGCTELATPEQFLEQLRRLGKELP